MIRLIKALSITYLQAGIQSEIPSNSVMEIVAAIITAVGAILAVIVKHFIEKRKKEKIEEEKEKELKAKEQKFEEQTLERAKSIHKVLSESFGWKAQQLTSKVSILNEEGDAQFVRRWRGVQTLNGESKSRLPGYFWASPSGSLKSSPVLSLPNGFPKNIGLNIDKFSDERCDYHLEITGSLSDDDPPLDYDISWERDSCVLMTKEEVCEAYKSDDFKHDYFSFMVGSPPMEELILEVNFPHSVDAEFYPGVFDGTTEYQVDREFQRTHSGFNRTPSGARFTIDHPLIGLRYFIYWIFSD